MASRRNKPINLPAPYLKRIWLEPSRITDREAYPFCLPLLRDDFELNFDRAITIIVGQLGLDMYDAEAKQLVWRGKASKTVDQNAKPDKRQKNLTKAVTKLLKNYPPPTTSR